MMARIVSAAGLVVAASIGCASTPPAPGAAPPAVTVAAVAPPASADPGAAAPEPAEAGPIKMYPVIRIHSLIDVTATDGGIEIRLGSDPGGGQIGTFRYVPLVNGVPDLAQETGEITRVDTTGGTIALAGKRPNLVYHVVSGFRSAPVDGYLVLGAGNGWSGFDPGASEGLGIGISPWSKDRLLEWRGPRAGEVEDEDQLPRVRVLRGADKEAPSLPRSLQKRLADEGFSLDTFTSFRTGEVLAVGRLFGAKGFGTVLWKENLKDPKYFVTESEPVTAQTEIRILGGTTLENVRLQANDHVMRFDGSGWVVEQTVAEGALPDVWFGSTLLFETKSGTFARLAAGAPWRPIEVVSKEKWLEQSFAVDPAGVIWKTEDDLLLTSKGPVEQLKDITEEDLEKARKGKK